MASIITTDGSSVHTEEGSPGTSLNTTNKLASCDAPAFTVMKGNDVSAVGPHVSDDAAPNGTTRGKPQRHSSRESYPAKDDPVKNDETNGSESSTQGPDQGKFSRIICSLPGASVKTMVSRLCFTYSALVGPEKEALPHKPTVALAFVSFCLFATLGGFLVRYHKPFMRYVALALSSSLLVANIAMVAWDFRCKESRRRPYRRNLCNTVLTVCLSLLVIPLLYNFLWYPNLIQQVLQFSEDTVDQVYFPSVAIFERTDWTSQANLDVVSASPKCFLGWYEENATDCNTLAPGTLPCRCDGSWSPEVRNFEWQNVSYRYLDMQATSAMLCNIPTTQMILQAFYWFNSTKEYVDSSWYLSPSVWVAIYDPTLTLREALENGYTRMILVNANGMTAVNLGLNYRQAFGWAPAYDYDLSISTIPATKLVCDLGPTTPLATGPCHISLFLQIPSFTRQTSLLTNAMGWTDVVGYAGAYFSFIQLISWIFSGLAFQT